MSNETLLVTVQHSTDRARHALQAADKNYNSLKNIHSEYALDLDNYRKILLKIYNLWREEEKSLESTEEIFEFRSSY